MSNRTNVICIDQARRKLAAAKNPPAPMAGASQLFLSRQDGARRLAFYLETARKLSKQPAPKKVLLFPIPPRPSPPEDDSR